MYDIYLPDYYLLSVTFIYLYMINLYSFVGEIVSR